MNRILTISEDTGNCIILALWWFLQRTCLVDFFRINKIVRIVNHRSSSQVFDAGSINFFSCSSCFAQKNCNFIHTINISLRNSQGKYKVKDAIYILDESIKIRPTASLVLSSSIIYAVHVSSAVTTLNHHIRCFFNSGFSSMKGRKCISKRRWVWYKLEKNIGDILKKKGVRVWVRHKDGMWRSFSEASQKANGREVLTDSLIITYLNIIGTLWPDTMTLCSLCLVVKLKLCQRQHNFLQLLAHVSQ